MYNSQTNAEHMANIKTLGISTITLWIWFLYAPKNTVGNYRDRFKYSHLKMCAVKSEEGTMLTVIVKVWF